jgi:uncharacterized membrane protein YeaQ/YmgE (transglycosylase-associated protein family)
MLNNQAFMWDNSWLDYYGSFANKGDKMGLLSWLVLGLLVGVIAKFFMPGKDPGGFVITIILGIAGAFVGGFISSRIGIGTVSGFDLRSLLIAVGGAILLLVIYRSFKK